MYRAVTQFQDVSVCSSFYTLEGKESLLYMQLEHLQYNSASKVQETLNGQEQKEQGRRRRPSRIDGGQVWAQVIFHTSVAFCPPPCHQASLWLKSFLQLETKYSVFVCVCVSVSETKKYITFQISKLYRSVCAHRLHRITQSPHTPYTHPITSLHRHTVSLSFAAINQHHTGDLVSSLSV